MIALWQSKKFRILAVPDSIHDLYSYSNFILLSISCERLCIMLGVSGLVLLTQHVRGSLTITALYKCTYLLAYLQVSAAQLVAGKICSSIPVGFSVLIWRGRRLGIPDL